MRYVARKRRAFQKAGFPVVSVDAKQRELVGNFKNAGLHLAQATTGRTGE